MFTRLLSAHRRLADGQRAPHLFRLVSRPGILLALGACAIVAACGNDDPPATTSNDTAGDSAANVSSTQQNTQQLAPAPWQMPSPNAQTSVQSAAASDPLVTPVIHTAD